MARKLMLQPLLGYNVKSSKKLKFTFCAPWQEKTKYAGSVRNQHPLNIYIFAKFY
jgi:hypothetical protein